MIKKILCLGLLSTALSFGGAQKITLNRLVYPFERPAIAYGITKDGERFFDSKLSTVFHFDKNGYIRMEKNGMEKALYYERVVFTIDDDPDSTQSYIAFQKGQIEDPELVAFIAIFNRNQSLLIIEEERATYELVDKVFADFIRFGATKEKLIATLRDWFFSTTTYPFYPQD